MVVAACGERSMLRDPDAVATAPPPVALGEANIVTILDDDGPFFDVRIDGFAPTGAVRPIASFSDVHPAGWDTAEPYYDMRSTVGPTGLVNIVVERNGGENAADVRTLLLDAHDPGRPPVEIQGDLAGPFWGPDGQLATIRDEASVVDTRTGAREAIPSVVGVEITPAWLIDGSGWPATRFGDDDMTVGSLSASGVFSAGRASVFEVTGKERFVGAEGGTLGYAVSDGADQSESALIEQRADLPPPCHCLTWASRVEPGDDPGFGAGIWDARGIGIWVIYAKDQDTNAEHSWLSHLLEPRNDRPVLDLPRGHWSIAGISSDDRWIILSDLEAGSLVLVDTAAGAAREIARIRDTVGPAPMFGGWVR
jgi:hypothetical protein